MLYFLLAFLTSRSPLLVIHLLHKIEKKTLALGVMLSVFFLANFCTMTTTKKKWGGELKAQRVFSEKNGPKSPHLEVKKI
jgi:hypothetical protein